MSDNLRDQFDAWWTNIPVKGIANSDFHLWKAGYEAGTKTTQEKPLSIAKENLQDLIHIQANHLRNCDQEITRLRKELAACKEVNAAHQKQVEDLEVRHKIVQADYETSLGWYRTAARHRDMLQQQLTEARATSVCEKLEYCLYHTVNHSFMGSLGWVSDKRDARKFTLSEARDSEKLWGSLVVCVLAD